MANCVTSWIFLRKRFCCCLPVRLGAAILSFFSLILGGLLMVILWFEVHTNYFDSSVERISFILLGILETLLFVASVLGFIGTCARKQSFVAAYAIFLYVHLLISIGVAGYFLWQVTSAANTDIQALCRDAIKNSQAEGQCSGLLNITKGVWWAGSLLVLAVETYCALVVTRYVNQLRHEKRDARNSRMLQRQSRYDLLHSRLASGTGTMEDMEALVGGGGKQRYRYSELSDGKEGEGEGEGAEWDHRDHDHDESSDAEHNRARDREQGQEKDLGAEEELYDPYAAYDHEKALAREKKAAARARRTSRGTSSSGTFMGVGSPVSASASREGGGGGETIEMQGRVGRSPSHSPPPVLAAPPAAAQVGEQTAKNAEWHPPMGEKF